MIPLLTNPIMMFSYSLREIVRDNRTGMGLKTTCQSLNRMMMVFFGDRHLSVL